MTNTSPGTERKQLVNPIIARKLSDVLTSKPQGLSVQSESKSSDKAESKDVESNITNSELKVKFNHESDESRGHMEGILDSNLKAENECNSTILNESDESKGLVKSSSKEPKREPSNDEQNTAVDLDHTDGQANDKRTESEPPKTSASVVFSDSSDVEDATSSPLHQLQGSPLMSSYPLMFPPTPPSELGRRPRPRRLSYIFDEMIQPVSDTSSMESPLLHAKHKSPFHGKKITIQNSFTVWIGNDNEYACSCAGGFHTGPFLQPQTPPSEFSLGVVQSVVDMLIPSSKEVRHSYEINL